VSSSDVMFKYNKVSGLCRRDEDGQFRSVGVELPWGEENVGHELAAVLNRLQDGLDECIVKKLQALDQSVIGQHVRGLVQHCEAGENTLAGLVGAEYDPFYGVWELKLASGLEEAVTRPEEPLSDEDGVIEDPESFDSVTLRFGDSSVTTTPQQLSEAAKLAGRLKEIGSYESGREFLRDVANARPQFKGCVDAVLGEGAKEEEEKAHPIQIPGPALHAILKEFNGKNRITISSVGVGEKSVAATDGFRGIVCGEVDSYYRATDETRTLVEGDWAKRYGKWCRLDQLPAPGGETDLDNPQLPNLDLGAPEYPNVGSLLSKHPLDQMCEVARLNPEMLAALGKTALSLGASEVSIYHDGTGALMGFRFTAFPAIGSGEDAVIGNPFPVQGLLRAIRKEKKAGGEADAQEAE
jgi:hypothetical protein